MKGFRVNKCRREDRDEFRRRMDERDPVAVRLGNNLKVLRVVNNESMESLARLFMLDKNTISLYEWGFRMPCLDTIESFSKYYDVSVDTLMHCDPTKLEKIIEKRRYPSLMQRLAKSIRSLDN